MIIFRVAVISFISTLLFWASGALAQSPPIEGDSHMAKKMDESYSFIKKRYSIDGSAQIISSPEKTQIIFDDHFRTKGGPDLKVYLSKKPLSELKNNSVNTHSVKIGVLKAKKGEQSYVIPDGISLSDFKSVVIHCEAYSVLWGGFDL